MGGINIWQILIILLVFILFIGSNKLRNIGTDLGSALKGFRNAMRDGEDDHGSTKKKAKSAEPSPVMASEKKTKSAEPSPVMASATEAQVLEGTVDANPASKT